MGLKQMEGGEGALQLLFVRKGESEISQGLALAGELCFKWVTRVQHIRCCCKADELLLSVKGGCL